MNLLFAIALGGAIGALSRYGVGVAFNLVLGSGFPFATLLVNVSGSFLIGLAYVFLVESSSVPASYRALLIVGFLGSFTTFSTFSLDTLQLIEAGAMVKAGVNVMCNLALCLLACWAGINIARV